VGETFSLALFVCGDIAAGKTQHGLRMQQQWQHCAASEKTNTDSVTLTSHPKISKINGFPGLIVEHLYVKFDDPSCISF